MASRLSAAWIIVLLVLAPGVGFVAEYSLGSAPAWVVLTTPGTAGANQANRGCDGVAYLLTDRQILAGAQRVTYRRLVSTALNGSGVDTVANIEISFDLSCQKLVAHSSVSDFAMEQITAKPD